MAANVAYVQNAAADTPERRSKGQRTREAIFETAINILSTEGYSGLTIATLAEGAGICRNSYYTHFSDLNVVSDVLSLQVLEKIGRKTFFAMPSSKEPVSVVMSRMQYVLSLPENDPASAHVLRELYINHPATADEVHRRLVLDIAADQRRQLLRMTKREAEMAALIIASGAIEFLKSVNRGKVKDRTLFLIYLKRLCGFAREVDT